MPLIIRNLTTKTIGLKRVERFKTSKPSSPAAGGKGGLYGISCITRLLTNLLSSLSGASNAELHEQAEPFEKEDIGLLIECFSSCKTDIAPPEDDVLRLIFESGGQQYSSDVPLPASGSATMIPVTQHANDEYTVIYSRQHHHLSIFLSSKLNSWMREFKDETPLSGLSIPGTHNSPTCHRALPSVRCQAVSPREQLENGVRFFDLRVQPVNPKDPSDDRLILVHSVFPISLTGSKYLRDLESEIHDFLDRNPSETMIVSLKREGTGSATDQQLSQILHKHYAGSYGRWYTEPRLPRLGEVRGKIVLLRRFGIADALQKEHEGRGWGIDASVWADNTPHALTPSGELCVQDFYEVMEPESIGKKITYATEQLARAASTAAPLDVGALSMPGAGHAGSSPPQPLFINFLSASNFWRVGCWPERIAARLNPAVLDYLCRELNEPAKGAQPGDGCTGIVVCDWVGSNGDWDLVRAVVAMNAKLLIKERSDDPSERPGGAVE